MTYKNPIDTFLRKVDNPAGGLNNLLALRQQGEYLVIKIGGEALQESEERIAKDLAALTDWSIYPIVIHGGGPQYDEVIGKNEKINGLRPTDKNDLVEILKISEDISTGLARRINAELKGSARALAENEPKDKIFIAEKYVLENGSDLGYVGIPIKVNRTPIIRCIQEKKIPIIRPIGYGQATEMYNINADTAAKSLILELEPKRVISLTKPQGILYRDGRTISEVALAKGKHLELIEGKYVTSGMKLKLEEATAVIQALGEGHSIQITSPEFLLVELLTTGGKGTKIWIGYNIIEHKNFKRIDKDKFKDLVRSSFKTRELTPRYFEDSNEVEFVLIEENYRGATVVKKPRTGFFGGSIGRGISYLDKIVVREESMGNGLGTTLLQEVLKKHKSIFWRARFDNPYNRWYYEQTSGFGNSGHQESGQWHIFWVGVERKHLDSIIRYAETKKETLVEIK